MGIIAGNGHESTGSQYTHTFRGIAPQANLVSVRVLDSQGQGTVSDIIAGLQWCVGNKNTYKIRVINLSLGHPVGESYTTDPLCQAAEAAYKAGIVVVCAAGNDGRATTTQLAAQANEGWGTKYGSIDSPGNDPFVITVGAIKNTDGFRADDHIATYSGRGPSRLDMVMKPDLVAPGNRVVSLEADNAAYLYQKYIINQIPVSSYSTSASTVSSPAYYTLSGTSMAAPVVAGAVALMLEKYPTLTPDTVKARLMLSADKWADPQGNADPFTYGASLGQATMDALLEAGLIEPKGRKEAPGRPTLWGTTPAFLVQFGLRHIGDLPRREDMVREDGGRDHGSQPGPDAR